MQCKGRSHRRGEGRGPLRGQNRPQTGRTYRVLGDGLFGDQEGTYLYYQGRREWMKDSQGIQKCAQIRTHLWHFMPGLMVFIFFANKKPGQPQIDRWQGGWETWGKRKMFRTPLERRGTYQEIWKKLTGKPLRALLTSEIYECILASTCEVNSCFLKLYLVLWLQCPFWV